MKKVIFLVIILFFISGCTPQSAVDPVCEYINKFRNHDSEVTSSIEELLRQENLLKEQDEMYRLIMKKQYVDLEYKVTKETYHGDRAIIEVELTVYDYEHSRIKSLEERNHHPEEFQLSDGSWDREKYVNLQLKYMKEETERVKYTVNFYVNLQDGTWVLENPEWEVLEKIHGLYRYQED